MYIHVWTQVVVLHICYELPGHMHVQLFPRTTSKTRPRGCICSKMHGIVHEIIHCMYRPRPFISTFWPHNKIHDIGPLLLCTNI